MIRKAFARGFLSSLIGLTALLVACQRQSVTESRDANRGTDQVTIYVSTDRVFSEPILKAYERKSGVKVNAVYDTEETKSTGLANKLLAEKNNPQDEKADEFFRELKANGVKIAPGNSVVRDLVVKGEVKMGLTDTDDVNVALEDKQPVAMVLPDRGGIGAPLMPNMVSLIAGAPRAEAGKKLIDYLLSAEVERELARSEAVQIPLRSGVEGPKNIPPVTSFKPMTLDYGKAAGRVEDVVKRLQPILGL